MIITKKLIYYVHSTEQSQEICLNIHNNDKQNMYVIHKTIKIQLTNQRQGNANTKTRSQVRGGGKKPWKQKGTGKARAGSIRSPLWAGGGVVFGPQTRTYKAKINKKEKLLALKAILYNKYSKTTVVDDFAKSIDQQPKTKTILNELCHLNIIKPNASGKDRILIILDKITSNQYLSARNLPNINFMSVYNLNLLHIIQAKNIIITLDALKIMQQKYSS
uniref:Large ribosomal subunit protein uL4c n=1 Tax=Crouania attenuata TaxID=42002 RepID=A0A4D6WP87_9FLOR|nr:ribosomal protein L4 [Crouania attenuata]